MLPTSNISMKHKAVSKTTYTDVNYYTKVPGIIMLDED